jgi:CRISPR/Cas system CMR-associated protein Cmr5 small subunit
MATTTRELERARHIHENLLRTAPTKEYVNRLKGAPAECMDNGLLQMLAFYHHKKDEQERIATQVEDWLRRCQLIPAGDPLDALARLPAVAYRRCSEEAIAWLNLAKRLAAARLAMSEASR